MTIQDVRPRAESISYLQWGRKHARMINGNVALKHVVQIHGPATLYNDEELEILSRATDLIDRASWPLRSTDAGYFPPSNPVIFSKSDATEPYPMWLAKRESWRSGTTVETLARAVSRFYKGYCLQPGWWISLADGLYDHGEPLFVERVDLPEIHTSVGKIDGTKIRLAAPTLVEITEFQTLDSVELVLQKLMKRSR